MMKTMRNIIATGLLLLSISSCADERLTLSGTISGLPDGCRLVLVNTDQDRTLDSVPTYADVEATEKFKLDAALDGPTLLRLVVTRYNPAYGSQAPVAAVSFMAGNEKVSLPEVSFNALAKYTLDETAEANVVIKGGRAQREYKEFVDSLRPLNAAVAALWEEGGEKIMDAKFGIENEEDDSVKMYGARLEKLQASIDQKTREFILQHPDYAVSALLVSRELNTTYKYTSEQIDSLLNIIAANPDTHRLDIARQNAAAAKRHAIGMALGNEEITLADGTVSRLHDMLGGDLTVIDCWASWCAPCRMAVPKLKMMSGRYAERLQIVSISCDRNEADWRKAMAEEKMSWPQAILARNQLDAFMAAYDVKFIPRLMLVKDAKILIATSDPDELERAIKKVE